MEAAPPRSSRLPATTVPDPSPPEAPAPPARGWRSWGLLRNLIGGLKLLLLRKVPTDAFARSFDQLLLLGIVNVLLWVGLETLYADPDSLLGLDGLYGLGCYVLIGLFGCALIARLQSPAADTRAMLVPLLSVAPYVLALFWAGSELASQSDQASTVALVVGLIYLAFLGLRILGASYGSVRLIAGLAAVLLVVVSPVVLDALDLDTSLWVQSDQDSDTDQDEANAEPILYQQPGRIEEAVSRLAPSRSDSASVYFVGFAGDGDQGIFKREALFAQSVFAAHFGSGARSVELINDDDDRDAYPLATVSGLEETLKLIGARMDRQRDVLVLTLTSHGDQDGLEVTNGNLPLLQLGPADLRAALDASGIKWRVVVVSACYSGVFVDALKSDTSLIITAADANHSSFGCDDDRELTYFGEAFLKTSMPTSDSLENAFFNAVRLIDARETAEHKPHSNPEIFMGSLMRQKLAALEGRGHPRQTPSLTVSAGLHP